MHEKFKPLITELHAKYEELIAMPPLRVDTVPKDAPVGGVYLFSSGGDHLYVGRTKRSLRDRVKDHVCPADDCPFAWHLAREATGQSKASYKREGSRADLLSRPYFRRAYEDAKTRIRKMDVRYVPECDATRQALLEIYVAVATGAKYNDFDTH